MANRGENIRKRKDGRWEGRYLREVNGDKKYRSVYGPTYGQVRVDIITFDEYSQMKDFLNELERSCPRVKT